MSGNSPESNNTSYFQSLREKSCKIDNGIDKLSEIWKTPYLMIGGYGERTAEIDAHAKELCKSICGTNVSVTGSV